MDGAFGKTNLVSENFERRRQFSAKSTQPAPSSPRPWTKMTVAVCLRTAGTISGGDMVNIRRISEIKVKKKLENRDRNAMPL
jgi:hypothetical protein